VAPDKGSFPLDHEGSSRRHCFHVDVR
jgi:hypothetical protein